MMQSHQISLDQSGVISRDLLLHAVLIHDWSFSRSMIGIAWLAWQPVWGIHVHSHKTDVDWVQDRNGNSPAQLAAAEGHISVVARILDSGRQGEDKGLSALHLATQAGVIPLVRQLLALPHCDRNAQDADGLTPLHWAASKGARSQFHLSCGSALEWAASKGARSQFHLSCGSVSSG